MIRLWCVPLLMVALCGCNNEPAWKKNKFTKIDQTRAMLDVEDTKVPRSLWSKIEALATNSDPAAAGAGETSKPGDVSIKLMPIKIYLIDKNQGILQQGSVEIEYGAGGGEIDLKDYVRPLNGSFYFVAEFAPELSKAQHHVFFLSNSVKRAIGEDSVGSGCSNYYDVSSAFQNAHRTNGFLVNTSGGRHVGALAGTFVFAAMHDGVLHLSSLTVKDSSLAALHCKL